MDQNDGVSVAGGGELAGGGILFIGDFVFWAAGK